MFQILKTSCQRDITEGNMKFFKTKILFKIYQISIIIVISLNLLWDLNRTLINQELNQEIISKLALMVVKVNMTCKQSLKSQHKLLQKVKWVIISKGQLRFHMELRQAYKSSINFLINEDHNNLAVQDQILCIHTHKVEIVMVHFKMLISLHLLDPNTHM